MPVEIKVMPFELPSKGQAYDPEKVCLRDDGTVRIKPFLSGHMRLLADSKDTYQGYYALIDQLLVDPLPAKTHIDHLLVSDVIFLIFMARIMGNGSEFHTGFRCSACSTAQPVVINLDGFECRTPEDLEKGLIADGLTVDLAGCKIEFHLPRLEDEKMIASWMNTFRNQKKLRNPETDRGFMRLAQLIDKVDDRMLSMQHKFEFLEQIPTDDFDYFDSLTADLDTGIRPLADVSCTNCGGENKLFVGLTHEFFRGNGKRHR